MQTDKLFDLIRKATHEKKLVWKRDRDVYKAHLRDRHPQQYNLTLAPKAWSIDLWVSRGNYIGCMLRILPWRKSPEEKMFLREVYGSTLVSERQVMRSQEETAECFVNEVSDSLTSLLESK